MKKYLARGLYLKKLRHVIYVFWSKLVCMSKWITMEKTLVYYEISTFALITEQFFVQGQCLNKTIILHEQSEQSKHSEVKGHYNFACQYTDGRVCICLCVCLPRLKSRINFDGMKGFWWNFQDQTNSLQLIFELMYQAMNPLSKVKKLS